MNKNVKFQNYNLPSSERARIKNQYPMCIWMTGLSGSGKTSLCNALDKLLIENDKHTYILDGDNLRHGLNSDLGFNVSDRNENVRRTAEVAKLMVDAGLIVIVGLISPFQKDRTWTRNIFKTDQFKEIYISTPLALCEKRDTKGLNKQARKGLIKDFTGIDSPYEIPKKPEFVVDTSDKSIDECVFEIYEKFKF